MDRDLICINCQRSFRRPGARGPKPKWCTLCREARASSSSAEYEARRQVVRREGRPSRDEAAARQLAELQQGLASIATNHRLAIVLSLSLLEKGLSGNQQDVALRAREAVDLLRAETERPSIFAARRRDMALEARSA